MTTQPSNTISNERNFRLQTLEKFVGQSDLKKTLRLMLDSAHQTLSRNPSPAQGRPRCNGTNTASSPHPLPTTRLQFRSLSFIFTFMLQFPLQLSSQGVYRLQQSGFRGFFDGLRINGNLKRAIPEGWIIPSRTGEKYKFLDFKDTTLLWGYGSPGPPIIPYPSLTAKKKVLPQLYW